MSNIALTDEIYWKSKSPTILLMVKAIQASVQTTGSEIDADQIAESVGRMLAAAGATGQGDLIDVPIMVWGWDPTVTMQMRGLLGYTWVPSALAPPVQVAPGLVVPGVSSYNPDAPGPMYIKVSSSATDYPPYATT